jgi:hypothetical protein
MVVSFYKVSRAGGMQTRHLKFDAHANRANDTILIKVKTLICTPTHTAVALKKDDARKQIIPERSMAHRRVDLAQAI